MPDRRPAPGMRWTTAVLVCMLVASSDRRCAVDQGSAEATIDELRGAEAATPLASTLTGVYTGEQAARGRNFYLGTCKSCHAPESHTGPTFAKYWKGKKLSDLFTFISTQMPKNDPGSLDPGDIADVMAYILKINAQPTGKDELYPDADSLKKFRIDVKQAGTSTAKGKKP